MKFFSLICFFFVLGLSGFARPDSTTYYASSRLDYYTDEKTGEILVFVPERLKGHKISIDLVFEYEQLAKGVLVPSTGIFTVPFQMDRMKVGQNEITVSFYEDEKWVDSRKIWVTVRPPHPNAIKIDLATGGLSVSGLPYFPFGFSSYFPVQSALPEAEVVKGFNLISPYQKIEKKSLKDRKTYMDRCAALGMKLNYNLCSVAGGGGVESSQLPALTKEQKLERLKKEVITFKDHPALLAWYIADEPDGQNIPADSLKEFYRLVKELDPYHPVSVLLKSCRKSQEYKDVMDIAMTDPFPIPQGKVSEVSTYTDILKNAFWLEKPIWIVPQAFGGNKFWQREPDPKEIRAMTYLAIIHGATGIQYFMRNNPNCIPKSTAMWDECGAMALEIAELTPEINSPHPVPELAADNPDIHARIWNRAGIVTLAVVNSKNEPGPVKIKMKDIDLTIIADVLFEGRKIQVKEGVIEDIIDGYGTRVYRFDARMKQDVQKGLQPGNLIVDPGFEDLSGVGVPSACSAVNGADPGCTYFVDSRRFYQGEHSLRMNNPSDEPGTTLSFYNLELERTKSYTISVMARGIPAASSAGKTAGPVRFRLGLGNAEKTFDCTENWQRSEISSLRFAGSDQETLRISPLLELVSKGTAWFDLLQVYPDMAVKVGKGPQGKSLIIELSSVHPDSKIFFTTDGKEPSEVSAPYIGPVEITAKSTIKAAAYKDGEKVGYIEESLAP